MSDDPARCAERVANASGFYFHQCLRKGAVDRDGVLYCRQHDPVARRERQDKKMAESDAYWERRQKQDKHELNCLQAIENTAARLGVDPVAFAEACQDGEFLEVACKLAGNPRANRYQLQAFADKLAALKRAEPGT